MFPLTRQISLGFVGFFCFLPHICYISGQEMRHSWDLCMLPFPKNFPWYLLYHSSTASLLGHLLAFLLAQTAVLITAPAPGLCRYDITPPPPPQFPCLNPLDIRWLCVCTCDYFTDNDLNMSDFSYSLYKGFFASSRPLYPWVKTHPSTCYIPFQMTCLFKARLW